MTDGRLEPLRTIQGTIRSHQQSTQPVATWRRWADPCSKANIGSRTDRPRHSRLVVEGEPACQTSVYDRGSQRHPPFSSRQRCAHASMVVNGPLSVGCPKRLSQPPVCLHTCDNPYRAYHHSSKRKAGEQGPVVELPLGLWTRWRDFNAGA